MRNYPKINSIYKRDFETGAFIEGEFSQDEFEYLKDNIWVCTEKMDGCFKKGTKILMYTLEEKPIEEIKSGEMVVVFDEITKTFSSRPVKQLIVQESDIEIKWIEIVLENGKTITCTEEHLFLTDRGWVEASNLDLKDNILDYNREV